VLTDENHSATRQTGAIDQGQIFLNKIVFRSWWQKVMVLSLICQLFICMC